MNEIPTKKELPLLANIIINNIEYEIYDSNIHGSELDNVFRSFYINKDSDDINCEPISINCHNLYADRTIEIYNYIYTTGNITCNGNLFCYGSIYCKGFLDIKGKIYCDGKIESNKFIKSNDDIKVTGNITAEETIYCGGNLKCEEGVIYSSDITYICGDLYCNQIINKDKILYLGDRYLRINDDIAWKK